MVRGRHFKDIKYILPLGLGGATSATAFEKKRKGKKMVLL